MKLLLLLALMACSTSKNEQKNSSPVGGESSAEQVSPYTVEPCYCMKIFMPVCADGKNYGNSCEAECHGHKKWTEGPCPSKKK